MNKCDYCDFFSLPTGNQPMPILDDYVEAVANEINAIARTKQVKWWSTVYIGGGTPSLLTIAQIRTLFGAIVPSANTEEVTFEANPRDITPQLLAALRECGVTRISCGFQSFSPSVLSGVHRTSTAACEERALQALISWQGTFSADMIAGLPSDTEKGLVQGLRTLAHAGAKHISLYTLTIEENTPLGQRIQAGEECGYDADRADAMWLAGRDALIEMGYEQYEVSNFALHGYRSRHNLSYWRMADYAGAGAGAVSSYYGAGVRITNTTDDENYIGYWLHHDDLAVAPRSVEGIDESTQQFEYFMLGLRTTDGVCEETYERRFGCKMSEKVLALFAEWECRGLARSYVHDGKLRHAMTMDGLVLLDRFLTEIM